MTTPNRPLTPEELFALVESNARAIEALANQAAQDREEFSMGIAELKMLVTANANAIAQQANAIAQQGQNIAQQGQNIDRYFAGQANHNRQTNETLNEFGQRLEALESD